MLRTYQPGTSEMPAWAEVTAARPCPCCASAAGCSVVEEDGFVHCRTQVSAWPILGGGWLHATTGARSARGDMTTASAASDAA